MAPLGQTFMQILHSQLQWPAWKFIRGCIVPRKPNSRNEGTSTRDGQALTQSRHAVQVSVKCSMLPEPGGETGLVTRTGIVVGLLWMIFFGLIAEKRE